MESLPRRNSDADFPDVFGGQPRRGRGRVDSFDFYSSWGGREEGVAHRSRWSAGPSEKPVFGELNSPARPRHLADDFFSDIFQGSESSCSSPRRGERDGFPSSPGSWVLSPTFPAMLSSSLPPRVSLSMKQAKGLDYPVFSSPTHRAINKSDNAAYDSFASSIPSSSNANASVPFVTTRAVPVQEDQRYDGYASYRQSPLSHQFKGNMDSSVEATDSAGRAQENTTCLEGHSRSSHFHFSIYKWAGKGVTLVMPSSSREHAKNGSRLRILPELVLQGVDVPPYDDYISTKAGASKVQTENESNKVLKNLTRERKDEADSIIMGDLLPAKFQFKVLRKEITEESRGEMEPLDVFSRASRHTASGEVSFTMREEWKPELKNLHQLLESESYRQVGSEDIIMQDQGIEVSTKDPSDADDDLNAKHRDGIKHVEVSSANMQENQATTTSVEDKLPGRRVKGKVKEFIKIFNQEVSVKPKGKIENLDRKTRGEDGKNGKVDVQATVYASKMDEEINTSRMNTSVFEDSSIAANQVSKKVEGPKYNISSDVNMIHDSSAGRNDNLFPCSEPPPESFDSLRGTFGESPTKQAPPTSFDSSTGNLEESHSGYLDGCLVEQLCEEQNEHAQTDSHQDQIQISDAKIREWSKGKEGNIRSLLSTLQYVLWSDSGWKPVPLVDIIEGTSVKRAYQKALLCLHPDKLQQKGAAMHQKYIAEKVFDILQEAWTHFNSISSIG